MPTRKTDETEETEEEQAAAEAASDEPEDAAADEPSTEESSSGAPVADAEDDGGRARRRELLAARRAELGDEELALSHPVLRGPAAFRGLTRRQVESIAPTDRELALALWEEANEAHLRDGEEEPERDPRKQPPSQLPPDYYTRS